MALNQTVMGHSFLRKFIFLSITVVSIFAKASECAHFYSGVGRKPFTNRQVLELLLKPVARKSTAHPATIVSSYSTAPARGGKSVLITDSMAVKGFNETLYDYENFEVEIIRPLVKMKNKAIEVSSSDTQTLKRILKQKRDYHGSGKESHLSVGSGSGDLIVKILEQLNFVFDRYITEKGWPPAFLQKLFYVAFKYASQSTYVVVREKGTLGQKGRIIGSIRLISTPYSARSSLAQMDLPPGKIDELAKSLLGSEKNWLPGFTLTTDSPGRSAFTQEIANWNPSVWNNIFGKNEIKVSKADIASVQIAADKDGLLSMPAPFESVLERSYSKERASDIETAQLKDGDLSFFVEPGNFAMIPDRDLPPELRGLAAPALYFHIARLVREASGAQGPATRIGTYASEGSSSDRFYQSLGFGLHESISPRDLVSGSPTAENWNVLMSNGNALTTALLNRFRLRMSEAELNQLFLYFDDFEKSTYKDSFYDRMTESLMGLAK